MGLYQGWSPQSDEDAAAFLAKMAAVPLLVPGEWTQLGIAEPGSDTLIGDVGIFIDARLRFAEIGFSVGTQSQGRGIATDAVTATLGLVFRHAAVPRIIAVTDDRNAACICLLERVGMRRMFTAPARFRGESCREHTYEIIAPQLQRPGA